MNQWRGSIKGNQSVISTLIYFIKYTYSIVCIMYYVLYIILHIKNQPSQEKFKNDNWDNI